VLDAVLGRLGRVDLGQASLNITRDGVDIAASVPQLLVKMVARLGRERKTVPAGGQQRLGAKDLSNPILEITIQRQVERPFRPTTKPQVYDLGAKALFLYNYGLVHQAHQSFGFSSANDVHQTKQRLLSSAVNLNITISQYEINSMVLRDIMKKR
jgi:hypothetical protein